MGEKENVFSWILQSNPRINKTQPSNEVMTAFVFVWKGIIMQE